ncbi:hypothetical protein L1887_28355 [Cichorium endivia]|nr:hypothetical protein L1887_28355 [Cichorium endivia]
MYFYGSIDFCFFSSGDYSSDRFQEVWHSFLFQVELSSLLDAARDTETKMVEMSALNHLMSTHVLQQAQQIEYLYDQAVEATKNVEMGNKELTQAIQRNSSSRLFIVLCFVVITFTLLFLDCYNT